MRFGTARTNTVEITMAVVHRHRVRTSLPQPFNTMRFAACHNQCFANHNGSNAQNRRGPQRRPRLWTLRRSLRREPGPQRRPRAPQPLLQSLNTAPDTAERAGPQRRPRAPQALLQSLDTAPDTAERAGPPAATTRAAGPSTVSGHCAGHCGESRAPSGDHARRSPFCSLWTLRRPLRREPGPQRRPRAPQPLLQSLDTAPATAERAGPQRRPRAPEAPLQSLNTSLDPQRRPRVPQQSLDTAERAGPQRRRRPFCSLWTLRRTLRREPGPQRFCSRLWTLRRTLRREPGPRRPNAPQALLQSLDTAPDTVERAQRRPRAPQPLLQSLDTARATAERAGTPPRPRAPQPLLQSLDTAPDTAERAGPPAATTRAAAPSAVSGHCAGHCGESRAQRRPRAPQPLLQSLDTAPDTAERAGPPAATTRAAGTSAVSGHCAGHCGESRAPSGDHARRSPFCSL